MTNDGSSNSQLTNAMRDVASRIERHRDCARDFVSAQKDRLQGIENRLTLQLSEIDDRLGQWEQFQSETECHFVDLHKQRDALDKDCSDVDSRVSDAEQRAADSDRERQRIAEERERIAEEMEQCQQAAEQLALQLAERDRRIESFQQQLEEDESSESSELTRLRDECERLQEEILALEGTGMDSQSSEEVDDLRARLELAIDDVRSLKKQNEELQESLQRASSDAASNDDQTSEGELTWEEHKQRLLSDIDAGEDDGMEPWSEQQLSIADEAIRRTDDVVAQMEGQISQLQLQLDEQREVAAQAALVSNAPPEQETSVLDADELVQQERHKLRELQGEWTEKLRQAEVEIAVERAQNARQQSELDEKMRDIQAELDRIRIRGESGADDSVQSRLMKRLGLGNK